MDKRVRSNSVLEDPNRVVDARAYRCRRGRRGCCTGSRSQQKEQSEPLKIIAVLLLSFSVADQ